MYHYYLWLFISTQTVENLCSETMGFILVAKLVWRAFIAKYSPRLLAKKRRYIENTHRGCQISKYVLFLLGIYLGTTKQIVTFFGSCWFLVCMIDLVGSRFQVAKTLGFSLSKFKL